MFNSGICDISHDLINIASFLILLIEPVNIDIRCYSFPFTGDGYSRHVIVVIFHHIIKCNPGICKAFRKIILHILLQILLKFFSVHHNILPPSDHMSVRFPSFDGVRFFLICHQSVQHILLSHNGFLVSAHCHSLHKNSPHFLLIEFVNVLKKCSHINDCTDFQIIYFAVFRFLPARIPMINAADDSIIRIGSRKFVVSPVCGTSFVVVAEPGACGFFVSTGFFRSIVTSIIGVF